MVTRPVKDDDDLALLHAYLDQRKRPFTVDVTDGRARSYDRLIRPLDYADKLALIRDTDMPVTRLMSVEQMTRYMDEVFRKHAEFGIALTIPPDKYAFDPERKRKAA